MKHTRLIRLVAVIVAAASSTGAAAPRSSLALLRAGSRQMVRIPAGAYRPLYSNGPAIPVAAFKLDKDPVTRAEFLKWSGREAGAVVDARRPMTAVTWSEANAFCKARGGRLPTLAEWEYVAAASEPPNLIALYSLRSASPPAVDQGVTNALGVRGMHDLVWEWVADPNERITAHHHGNGQQHDMSCAGSAIGASDTRDYAAFLRAALRSGLSETSRLTSLGFRCAA